MQTIAGIIAKGKVIPVVTLEHKEDAIPVAEALLTGGIKTIEITLRTKEALAAITLLAKANTGISIGAGTVIDKKSLTQAVDAGAEFIVSPGTIKPLLKKAGDIPYLPGVATASDMMLALAQGFQHVKFFPAEGLGGVAMLKHYLAVFPQLSFCPTGGISPENVKDYLALKNVPCVGGSWIASKELIAEKAWERITQNSLAVAGC